MSVASLIISFIISWQLSLILASFASVSAFAAWGYGMFGILSLNHPLFFTYFF